MDRYTADNLANWNDRVPIHVSSDLYQIDELVSDPDHLSSVVAFDRDYLGDVSGKTRSTHGTTGSERSSRLSPMRASLSTCSKNIGSLIGKHCRT